MELQISVSKELNTEERRRLSRAVFGLPDERKYPMPDRAHAINAKGRAKQELDAGNLTEEQYDKIVETANKMLSGTEQPQVTAFDRGDLEFADALTGPKKVVKTPEQERDERLANERKIHSILSNYRHKIAEEIHKLAAKRQTLQEHAIEAAEKFINGLKKRYNELFKQMYGEPYYKSVASEFEAIAVSGLQTLDHFRSMSRYSGKSGLYVQTVPTIDSIRAMNQLLEAQGFPSLDWDPHCSIMYSKETPEKAKVKALFNPATKYTAQVVGITHWPGHDKKGYLVLKLDSESLSQRHDEYKAAGAVPTFDPFESHITVRSGLPITADLQAKIRLFNLKCRRTGGIAIKLHTDQLDDIDL